MSTREDRLWALGYALLATAFFAPILTGRLTLYHNDTHHLYYPARALVFGQLQAGLLPLWTRLIGAGYPILSEGQCGGWYPGNLLAWLLPTPLALSWTVWLHAVIAAVLMHGFVRSLGARAAAAGVAAISFMFSGAYVAHLVYVSMALTIVWLPGVCWGLEAGFRQRSGRPFLLGAGALAMALLAVHVQMAAYVALTALAYGLARWSAAAEWRPGPLWLIGLFALAGGLAAVQLLPMAELAGHSLRGAALERRLLTEYALTPMWLLFLFMPHYFGHPTLELAQWSSTTVPWELAGYFGVTAAVLALAAPMLCRRRAVWALAVLWWGTFFLAWGRTLPLFEWLHHLPAMSSFRIPSRWLVPGTFAGSALAGLATDGLLRRAGGDPRTAFRLALLLSMPAWALAGLAYLPAAVYFERGRIGPAEARHAALCAGWCLAVWFATALSVGLAWVRPRRWLLPGLLAVLVVELFVAHRGYNPVAPPSTFTLAGDPVTARVAARLRPGERVFCPPWTGPPLLCPIASVAVGLPTIENYVPLKLQAVDEALDHWRQELEPQHSRGARAGWLRGATHALAEVDAVASARRLRWLRLMRVRVAPPRYAPQAPVDADGLAWIDHLAPPAWELESGRVAAFAVPTGSRAVVGPAAGWVVLSEAAYPGWRAYDETGRAVPVAAWQGRLRAVAADGARVRLVYRPITIRLGLFLSLVCLAVWMGACQVSRSR